MDAKKVTPRARSTRSSRKSESSPPADTNTNTNGAASAFESLTYKIEDERSRLMTAEAVLHCVVIAMDEADGDVTTGPDYATLIELARDLIKQSIDKLDSVRLKATLQKVVHEGRDVKEELAEYVVH